MGYIILHNRQCAASRDFVAALPESDHKIIEWYTDVAAVAEYMATIGVSPSAFPSVVIRVPDKEVAESVQQDTGETIPAHVIPAHWELLRCPANLEEVDAVVASKTE